MLETTKKKVTNKTETKLRDDGAGREDEHDHPTQIGRQKQHKQHSAENRGEGDLGSAKPEIFLKQNRFRTSN